MLSKTWISSLGPGLSEYEVALPVIWLGFSFGSQKVELLQFDQNSVDCEGEREVLNWGWNKAPEREWVAKRKD